MPTGNSTWDIRLKSSPEEDENSLSNILARKLIGTEYNSAVSPDSGNAMSRRMDIINQTGFDSTQRTLQAVNNRQQQKEAGALAVGNTRLEAAKKALSDAQAVQLKSGYVNTGSTKTPVGNKSPVGNQPYIKGDAMGNSLVRIASTQKGLPYVYGGGGTRGASKSSLAKGNFNDTGFDCSGLVQYVYGKMGIKMPRVSQQQATMGTKVTLDKLKPGDLVAWGSSPRTATHIAIYAGGGKVWEAAKTGTNVRTRSINDSESGIMGISIKR